MTHHQRGLRAALYARHAIGSHEDLEAQLDRCRAFAAENGLKVLAAYQDPNCCGSGTADRPGLKELLAATADGAFDILIVRDFDRLSRSALALAELLLELADNAVEVLVADGCNEPYMSVTAFAEMLSVRRG